MKKWISPLILIGSFTFISASVYAQDDSWKGTLYEITPKSSSVTLDYCKSHVPDTYTAPMKMVNKEIVGANGVKAKDLGFTSKEVGGIYFRNGTAMLSGTTDGKTWEEKVYYFGQSLQKEGAMEQGAWYTKDCKGFYKVGPSSMDMNMPMKTMPADTVTTTPAPADTSTPDGTSNGTDTDSGY